MLWVCFTTEGTGGFYMYGIMRTNLIKLLLNTKPIWGRVESCNNTISGKLQRTVNVSCLFLLCCSVVLQMSQYLCIVLWNSRCSRLRRSPLLPFAPQVTLLPFRRWCRSKSLSKEERTIIRGHKLNHHIPKSAALRIPTCFACCLRLSCTDSGSTFFHSAAMQRNTSAPPFSTLAAHSASVSHLLTILFIILFCYTADLQEALILREVSQHSQFQLRVISCQNHSSFSFIQENMDN